MARLRDRLISIHRYEVDTALFGLVSVYTGFIIASVIDILFLGGLYAANFLAVENLKAEGFLIDLIITTVLSVLCFLALCPGTIIQYIVVLVHLSKMTHLAFVFGKVVTILYINTRYLLKGEMHGGMTITTLAENFYKKVSFGFGLMILRYFCIFIALYLVVVLERIRFSGGTGRESKSAEELDKEKFEIQML
ncbi:hypothetical protein BdWA1_001919 [Babesia duncani]|uniref:Uncharacterized protein n=1 Tax=Babesia duncani TaxID=323732 RepID=A0AAD9PKS9_9APIC|nr:hypothetical protein BdWA1_001919 [Babesia duncani]